MYEAEVNNLVESIETLPVEIRKRFAEYRDEVDARTILPWGEHCTECVWPICYTTCELYSPRSDGACRQFVDGMVRIDHPDGLNPYLLKVRFRPWAKLWTLGNLQLHTLSSANGKERLNIAAGAVARSLPLPGSVKKRVLQKVNYVRRQLADYAQVVKEIPDYFLLECYNPNSETIELTFSMRLRNRKDAREFQRIISASPGFSRCKVPMTEISLHVDLRQAFEVQIVPNNCEGKMLYFGIMDFVRQRRNSARGGNGQDTGSKWKCIVWDLDNTLWDGTLIEDGFGRLKIRQGVVDVIKETDRRGILHSIASKNNYEEAMKVLQAWGIEDYFLYPQIGWQPKSQSIARIAQLLNIGVDTISFVDDQAFEREEVKSVLPNVTLVDAAHYSAIPHRRECAVPETEESRNRRMVYRAQQQRNAAQASFGGDFIRFLREADIQISISSLNEDNLLRVYELAQRTNQLNFSGNRYPQDQLREILAADSLETSVIKCRDKFGSYGIVGFALVDAREPRLLDLMFSCRIQGKRIEHAVVAFLLKRYVKRTNRDFYANYRKTERNANAGKVFEEMGFEQVANHNGVLSLAFRNKGVIADDGIVSIVEN